jgi:hypothetical protein
VDFRNTFGAKLETMFVVPAETFDNVKGKFPIGFMMWDTSIKEQFVSYEANILDAKGEPIGNKTFFSYNNGRYINDWMKAYFNVKNDDVLGYLYCFGNDFQTQNYIRISNIDNHNHSHQVYTDNLLQSCIYLSVRKVIPATWLNDRDQFLYPNDEWKYDKDFHYDCLAYSLFNNNIQSEYGINHWIPFTEKEVNAPDNFKSHFMSDFIAGKCAPVNASTLFGEDESLIPTEPIVFTPAAQAVMEAGRKIWEYYMQQKPKIYGAEPINVDASFYDIRAYFQGRDEKGKMNSESGDATYTALLKDLRTYQKVLAKQIEKKVYLYGFLKGEAQVDPTERLHELERQNAELRHKLVEQQKAAVTVHIDTYNDNSTNYNVEK